jgi:hypothetical protein
VFGDVSSSTAIAVFGNNSSTAASNEAPGVMGISSAVLGRGVWGQHAGTGAGFGMYGQSGVAAGRGVYGTNIASSGASVGLQGVATTSTGGIGVAGSGGAQGVQGTTANTGGYGVLGINTGATSDAIAVQGQSASPSAFAVVGFATSSTGVNHGVLGQSNSSDGTGVRGECNGSSVPWGVWGVTSGAGLSTLGGAAIGVRGENISSATNSNYRIGVYGGVNSTGMNSYAGYFQGKVHVNGALSKGSGTFKIDHPLDPANKYLYHSFVESPDMKNIYDGVVTLNAVGESVVQLPEYFGALNKDFRYQLTCIGQHAPVYVADEIAADARTPGGSWFKISGGRPGMKVSWQVTGIRQDAYANMNRVVPEVDKQPGERGLYLYPEAFGLPAEKSIMGDDAKARAAREHIVAPAQPGQPAAGDDAGSLVMGGQ